MTRRVLRSALHAVFWLAVPLCWTDSRAREPVGAFGTSRHLVVTNVGRMHGDTRTLVGYCLAGDSNTLHVSFADGSSTNAARPTEFLRFPSTNVDWARSEIWLSGGQPPMACLLLREHRFQAMADWSVVPYRVEASGDVARVFNGHTRHLDARTADQEASTVRVCPISVRLVLRGKLESSSPSRDYALPAMAVRSVEQVHLADSATGPAVTGILNQAWAFALQLNVDLSIERAVPSDLRITRVDSP
jgi:hypothetical protein